MNVTHVTQFITKIDFISITSITLKIPYQLFVQLSKKYIFLKKNVVMFLNEVFRMAYLVKVYLQYRLILLAP